jgi:hypothetical protein
LIVAADARNNAHCSVTLTVTVPGNLCVRMLSTIIMRKQVSSD